MNLLQISSRVSSQNSPCCRETFSFFKESRQVPISKIPSKSHSQRMRRKYSKFPILWICRWFDSDWEMNILFSRTFLLLVSKMLLIRGKEPGNTKYWYYLKRLRKQLLKTSKTTVLRECFGDSQGSYFSFVVVTVVSCSSCFETRKSSPWQFRQ